MLGDININSFCSYFRDMIGGGRLSFKQKDGLERIVNYATQQYPALSHAQLAYIIATAYHESARSLQPVKEMGSNSYLKSKEYYPYIGGGLVQVTWEYNYKKFGAKTVEDLLTWPVALDCLFRGMIDGMFTGKRLSDFIGEEYSPALFEKARAIINGKDKASLIASYAMSIVKCLEESTSKHFEYVSNPVTEPKIASNAVLISAATTATGGTVAAISNIQNIVNGALKQENVDIVTGFYRSLGDFAPWIIICLIVIGASVILIREIKQKTEKGHY